MDHILHLSTAYIFLGQLQQVQVLYKGFLVENISTEDH